MSSESNFDLKLDELFETTLKKLERKLQENLTSQELTSIAMTLDDLRYRQYHTSGASSTGQEKKSARRRNRKK